MTTPNSTAAVTCPCCDSPSLQAIEVKSMTAGRAFAMEVLFGTAVGVAAGQTSTHAVMCLKCGQKYRPNGPLDRTERLLRGHEGLIAQQKAADTIRADRRLMREALDGMLGPTARTLALGTVQPTPPIPAAVIIGIVVMLLGAVLWAAIT